MYVMSLIDATLEDMNGLCGNAAPVTAKGMKGYAAA